jgi:hypothetical protein
VQAVVNGRTSSVNPTVTKTLRPVGIWLQDPSRGIAVQLLGQDPGSWAMGEEATTHSPVSSTRPVRITQALRGFEGSVAGSILEGAAGTVAQQVQAIYDLKKTPGRTYLLTLSDMTIPVIVGNLVPAPTPGAELEKSVSFDFWQDGQLPFAPSL